MATVSETKNYPTSDGKPMAETEVHRDLTVDLIYSLKDYYADDPMTYASGDLLIFYERGNRRRHLAPDVFVVRGVPNHRRENYLVWEEGKGPDFVIEVSSKSTRKEDLTTKRELYRGVLKVAEYFLYDPLGEYLKPRLQGFRLVGDDYRAIEPVAGRLPSEVTGLHLEAHGEQLRLYHPAQGRWLPTTDEKVAAADANSRATAAHARAAEAHARAAEAHARTADALLAAAEAKARVAEVQREATEAKARVVEVQREAAEAKARGVEAALHDAEGEMERLRREIEELRSQARRGE